MDDHTHEWQVMDSWPIRGEELYAECFWGWKASEYKIQCPATLDEKEIERRLNATERLNAEDAHRLANDYYPDNNPLRHYAAALEGEDNE